MKNVWTDEVTIRRTVVTINENLRKMFVGSKGDIKQFSDFLNKVLNGPTVTARVRDAVIWRYNLEAEVENGAVASVKLVKLSWIL